MNNIEHVGWSKDALKCEQVVDVMGNVEFEYYETASLWFKVNAKIVCKWKVKPKPKVPLKFFYSFVSGHQIHTFTFKP